MTQIYISVGTNINKEENIKAAIVALDSEFEALVISSVYESEAVGFDGDNFFNLVVGAKTQKSLAQVAQILKSIEKENGRIHSAKKFSARTLDLDLLTFDDVISDEPVQIPRHEITENAFVLWPLAEIAQHSLHPSLGQSYGDIWQAFDQTKQKLWTVPFEFSQLTNLNKQD